MKKGQVTLLVILGIIIVAIISLAIYYNKTLPETEVEIAEREALSEEEKSVAKAIDDCLEETLRQAILQISKNGGYNPPKVDSAALNGFNVPLYVDKGREELPSINHVKLGIERYIDENLKNCLSVNIPEQPKTEVHIESTVKAETSMLVVIGDSRINKFYAEVNIDLEKILDDVKAFYNKVKVYNYTINLLDFNEMAVAGDYKFDFTTVEDISLFFLIWENYINGEDLTFTFGIRKDQAEEVPETISVIDEYTEEELPEDLQDPKEEDYEGVDYESNEANEAGENFGTL